jgi:hypothetical protein
MRDALTSADAAAFVGRVRELRAVDDFLAPASPHRLLFVHGTSGIGKSALLREVSRRGSARGYSVVRVEPDSTDAAEPTTHGQLLLLIDDVPQVGVQAAALRDRVLDRTPGTARVVIASRERPNPEWWRDGLDTIARELRLDALPDVEARRLLETRGLSSPSRQDVAIAWAHGSPLALVVAAASEADPVSAMREADLEDRLGGRLTGDAIARADPDVLEVAALTSPVDSRLLAAALPGRRLRGAMSQLWALPEVSRVGHGAALHPSLRTAIALRLRADNTARYDELVRRIALHLERRSRLGDHDALVQLTALVESPSLISGISRGGSRTHFADSIRPGDAEQLAEDGRLTGREAWTQVEWFLDRFPRHTTIVRGVDGALAGMIGAAPMSAICEDPSAPARAVSDLLVSSGCDPDRTLAGPAILLESTPAATTELLRVGFSSSLRRGGVADLRHWLTHYPNPEHRPSAFLSAASWVEVPLWAEGSSWLMDWGPAGAIGYALNTVLHEHGYADRPGTGSLLAPGSEPRLAVALGQIFSDSADDRALRQVIELAHLSPDLTRPQVLSALHVSRATYFRMLRRARERVLDADAGHP